jgi:hypothetical protein
MQQHPHIIPTLLTGRKRVSKSMPFDLFSTFKSIKHQQHFLLFSPPSQEPIYTALLCTPSAQIIICHINLSKHPEWTIQTKLLGNACHGHKEVEPHNFVDMIISLDPQSRTNMNHLFEAIQVQRGFLKAPVAESVKVWLAQVATNKLLLLYSLEQSASGPCRYLT